MPELPEVETITNELRSSDLIGDTLLSTLLFWKNSVVSKEKIEKQKIVSIERLGKWILFQLELSAILIHLRMTGKLYLVEKEEPLLSHERVRLFLKSGRALAFVDPRKFGKIYFVKDKQTVLHRLGLDALSDKLDEKKLLALLKKSSSTLKSFLLDQKKIAGIGNIYADEILFHARLHPLKKPSTLSFSEIKRLHKAVKIILTKAVRRRGTSLGHGTPNYQTLSGKRGSNQNYLAVYGRSDMPCVKCKKKIHKITVIGRSTHFCPNCQKA